MRRTLNPASVIQPASHYAQAVEQGLGGRRLVISGQVGVTLDGMTCEGRAAQHEQAWANILALLDEAGMTREDLVSIRVYDVAPGDVAVYRAVRDRVLGGHLLAATYVVVAGLASPALHVEIEAEAVRE
jgi:2-iminobutanoate/2-iminopropanoate deaminase